MPKTARFLIAMASAATIFVLPSAPAIAQSPHDAEIIGFHQLCNQGDRRACVKFGMMLEHDLDMRAEWRRTHPEWFWWER